MGRYSVLAEILRLDPVTDHQRITYLSTCYDFPFDTTRALELALFRTFAVAKGSALLAGTGEFTQRPQKRYDDTVLLLAEILEHGYDSSRGKAAMRRMNQMHHRYAIPNDEFLYVLSTFIYEPIRWNARFGWRPYTSQEKLAAFYIWREIGRRMNIRDIPDDFAAFEAYNIRYEQTHFRFAAANHQLATACRDLFLGWWLPKPLWPFAAPALYALMDDRLREAVGFPAPSHRLQRLMSASLKLRARILRRLPPRRHPRLMTQQRHPSYPHGYRIDELGAH